MGHGFRPRLRDSEKGIKTLRARRTNVFHVAGPSTAPGVTGVTGRLKGWKGEMNQFIMEMLIDR